MECEIILNLVDENGNPVPHLNIDDIVNETSPLILYTSTENSNKFDFIDIFYRDILTIEQQQVVSDMLSKYSHEFRSDYNMKNRRKMLIWDTIVKMLPKCNSRLVYRYLNSYDRLDLQVGDVLQIEHSLTTTRIGRGFKDKNQWIGKYIIKLKSSKKTRAHDVSVLWNPNCSILKGEKQVNFEERTSFKVDKVINVYGKPYIYMHEI